MEDLSKPTWHKPLDYLLLALPAGLIALFLAVLNSDNVTTGDGDPLPAGTVPMIGVVAAVALAIVAYRFISRYVEWKKWTYIALDKQFAFMVKAGDYDLNADDVQAVALETFANWSAVYGMTKVRKVAQNGVIWAEMREGPYKYAGREVNGHTHLHTRRMVVGYTSTDQSLTKTSFAHEMGHIIQGEVTGKWDEETHHEVAETHGLK